MPRKLKKRRLLKGWKQTFGVPVFLTEEPPPAKAIRVNLLKRPSCFLTIGSDGTFIHFETSKKSSVAYNVLELTRRPGIVKHITSQWEAELRLKYVGKIHAPKTKTGK